MLYSLTASGHPTGNGKAIGLDLEGLCLSEQLTFPEFIITMLNLTANTRGLSLTSQTQSLLSFRLFAKVAKVESLHCAFGFTALQP